MTIDFSAVFARYEALAAEADAIFTRVQEANPSCRACSIGCSDCCEAMFDLTLVEAVYINRALEETYGFGPQRSAILERAGKVDRQAVRIKRDFYRASREGKPAEEILDEAAKVRLRCPLLSDENTCLLYEKRPLTCRFYGIPTSFGGKSHVCGKTGFEPGKPYPAVNMDVLHNKLEELSKELAESIGSRYKELHTVHVPVSMALLTRYDEEYLGVKPGGGK